MALPLCSDAYDDVTGFEIWDFTKTQKSRCLENATLFSLINYTSRATLLQKQFCSGVNL